MNGFMGFDANNYFARKAKGNATITTRAGDFYLVEIRQFNADGEEIAPMVQQFRRVDIDYMIANLQAQIDALKAVLEDCAAVDAARLGG